MAAMNLLWCCPNREPRSPQRVGERIRERLAADAGFPEIAVSVGAAVFPEDGQTIEELLDAADRRLYGMKRRGNPVFALSRIAAHACDFEFLGSAGLSSRRIEEITCTDRPERRVQAKAKTGAK